MLTFQTMAARQMVAEHLSGNPLRYAAHSQASSEQRQRES